MSTLFFKHSGSDVHFYSTVHFPSLNFAKKKKKKKIIKLTSLWFTSSEKRDLWGRSIAQRSPANFRAPCPLTVMPPIRQITSIPIMASMPGTRWSTTIVSVLSSLPLMFRLMLLTPRHFTSLALNALMLIFPIHPFTKSARTIVVVQPASTRALTLLSPIKTPIFGVTVDPVPRYLLALRYPFIRFLHSFWPLVSIALQPH